MTSAPHTPTASLPNAPASPGAAAAAADKTVSPRKINLTNIRKLDNIVGRMVALRSDFEEHVASLLVGREDSASAVVATVAGIRADVGGGELDAAATDARTLLNEFEALHG